MYSIILLNKRIVKVFFVDMKGSPHKYGGVNLPIYRDCFGDLFLSYLLQLKAFFWIQTVV